MVRGSVACIRTMNLDKTGVIQLQGEEILEQCYEMDEQVEDAENRTRQVLENENGEVPENVPEKKPGNVPVRVPDNQPVRVDDEVPEPEPVLFSEVPNLHSFLRNIEGKSRIPENHWR